MRVFLTILLISFSSFFFYLNLYWSLQSFSIELALFFFLAIRLFIRLLQHPVQNLKFTGSFLENTILSSLVITQYLCLLVSLKGGNILQVVPIYLSYPLYLVLFLRMRIHKKWKGGSTLFIYLALLCNLSLTFIPLSRSTPYAIMANLSSMLFANHWILRQKMKAYDSKTTQLFTCYLLPLLVSAIFLIPGKATFSLSPFIFLLVALISYRVFQIAIKKYQLFSTIPLNFLPLSAVLWLYVFFSYRYWQTTQFWLVVCLLLSLSMLIREESPMPNRLDFI